MSEGEASGRIGVKRIPLYSAARNSFPNISERFRIASLLLHFVLLIFSRLHMRELVANGSAFLRLNPRSNYPRAARWLESTPRRLNEMRAGGIRHKSNDFRKPSATSDVLRSRNIVQRLEGTNLSPIRWERTEVSRGRWPVQQLPILLSRATRRRRRFSDRGSTWRVPRRTSAREESVDRDPLAS